ncbi:MAG: flavodoxin domain-containing protein [Planctomycetota bacterium]
MCPKIGIYYASSGGRTRRVAGALAEILSERAYVEANDIRSAELAEMSNWDLLILGSPTYGSGELHPNWTNWNREIISMDLELATTQIAVFALGDQRHHRSTFGDAIWRLEELRNKLGSPAVGEIEGPDGNGDRLPGLVLDAISQRRSIPSQLVLWAKKLFAELETEQQHVNALKS